MKTNLDDVVARLRRVAAVRTLNGLTDRTLLGRFTGSNDGEAFAALVERHGPMVLGVCRRLLPHHDAEDACQAVFLVLARKAASLLNVESLGSWLHGVARRVAANARRDAELRKAREAGAAKAVANGPAGNPSWSEVQLALDEELGRLPERYRAPLVLCYLEGLTRDEAAARLGVSAGTLHGRLERGREALRARLSKRGLSLSAVLTATATGDTALPPLLAVKTANAAALFAAGQPISEVVGRGVLALTREVLVGMSMTKVKVATAAVLGIVLAVALIGGSVLPAVSAQGKQKETEPSPNQVKRAEAELDRSRQKPGKEKAESDEAFIRRVSNDLLERDPTPAEVHFFLASKEEGKRRKLIDLFIEERNAKKKAVPKEAPKRAEEEEAVQAFILKHAAATELAKALEKVVQKKGARIVAEDRTNSVVVRARKADMDGIRKLVEAWDALAAAKGDAPPKKEGPKGKESPKDEEEPREKEGPARKEDADRKAATYALSVGGEVRNERWETVYGSLPKGPFELRVVRFMGNAKVTDEGLAVFEGCENLEELFVIQGARVSDAGLAHFSSCKKLNSLCFTGTKFTDAGLAHFAKCEALMGIGLEGTEVSDDSIAMLSALPNLRYLNLKGTRVTAAGIAALKKAKPRCGVEWEPRAQK